MGRPSWRSSFLCAAGVNFFCTGHDVLEILISTAALKITGRADGRLDFHLHVAHAIGLF